MHQLQKILLKRLLLNNQQKYSQLTRGYDNENNILFHLKQLLNKKLISKNNQAYSITTKGIKTITQFDLSLLKETGFKTFFIGFLCQYQNQYLIKNHPTSQKNFYNLPSGKPRFGKPIEQFLTKLFHEQTNLDLKPTDFKYLSLHLKTIKTSQNKTLFDDAFAIYKIKINPQQKQAMQLSKNIQWMTLDQIKKLSNRWPELDICIINKNTKPYHSYQFTSNYIL